MANPRQPAGRQPDGRQPDGRQPAADDSAGTPNPGDVVLVRGDSNVAVRVRSPKPKTIKL